MHTALVHLEIGLFDEALSAVVGPDRTVRLSPCETRLLAFLAAHPGRYFTVEALQREVWGYASGVNSRTAYVTLSRLRSKIEVDPNRPRHLVAVRTLGYRFTPLLPAVDNAEAQRLVRRLEALGYRVSLEPGEAPADAATSAAGRASG